MLVVCIGAIQTPGPVSTPKSFHFTTHANRRSAERAITEELFVETVTSCDKRTQQHRGTHGGFVYLFTKKFGERELHVAAEGHKDECFFVTGYWT